MKLKTLKEANIEKGMRVLVRVDFNEPLANGLVSDDYRIKTALPTINFLLKKGARIILISHLGRPNGKKVASLSLLPVQRLLSRLLRKRVILERDFSKPYLWEKSSLDNEIVLLENIRFWPEEEKCDLKFAKKLASLGDFYVNDAFGASHRAHASISGIPKYLPCAAGFLLEKEVRALEKLLRNQRRPFFVVLGGAKASTKIDLVKKYLEEADGVLAGGAIGNTILAARGFSIGRSLADGMAKNDLKKYVDISSLKLHSPLDAVVVNKVFSRSKSRIVHMGLIGKKDYIVDIGPETCIFFAKVLESAKTILWNGPMGVIEIDKFSRGTLNLVKALKKIKAYKVTGGGDTIAFLKKHRLMDVFNHISTGGGAMMEFLAGKKLPGIEVLRKK